MAAISEANRANVSVYAVDARGLTTAEQRRRTPATPSQEAVLTSMRQQTRRGFRPVTREEMLDRRQRRVRAAHGHHRHPGRARGAAPAGCSSRTRTTCAPASPAPWATCAATTRSPTPRSNRSFDGKFRKVELKVTPPGRRRADPERLLRHAPGRGQRPPSPTRCTLLEAMRAADPPHDLPIRARAFRFGHEDGRASGTRWCWSCRSRPSDFEPDKDPSVERAHFSFMGVLRSARGAGGREVQPGRAAVAAAQAARRRCRRETRSSCARSPFRRGRYRLETAVLDQQSGRTSVEPQPAGACPRDEPALRPEQPRGREAHRARAEGSPRLRRSLPGRRGAHRPLGRRGGARRRRRTSASSSWPTCLRGRRGSSRRSRSSSSATAR